MSYAICSEYFCFPLQFLFKINQCIHKLENTIKDPCTIYMLLQNDCMSFTASIQKKVATRWQRCKYDFSFHCLDSFLWIIWLTAVGDCKDLFMFFQTTFGQINACWKPLSFFKVHTIWLFKNCDLIHHGQLLKK